MQVAGVEKRRERTSGDVALFTGLRVFTAVAFILLSFIPVAGEAGEAGLISAEAGLEASLEIGLEEGAEAALEVANTARYLRLGDTIKGSLGLGIAEAGVNEIVDRVEGTDSLVNSLINFGLAFTPTLGAAKGRRAANIRFAKTIEAQIAEQNKLLKIASSVSERADIEARIRQLKNAKLVRTSRIYGAPIDSAITSTARKEALEIVNEAAKQNISITKRQAISDLRQRLLSQEIKISKNESKYIVNSIARKVPSIKEGITVKGIVESRTYNKVLTALQWADPNLAARKVWTGLARKLSTDEALFRYTTKSGEVKEFGKWFKKWNLGYYKRFGKRLSKWWRKMGSKIYAHSRVRMIPVLSKWIDGYRLIPTSIPNEYIMIVIFKPSKNGRVPPPVVVNPVTMEYALKFAAGEGYGGSVGSFYINRIALARNGSGPSISGNLASILGPLSLGTLRKALSGPAAFERIIRKVVSGKYFNHGIDDIIETSARLIPHKVGKVIAGRWGIAAARGFQHTSKGHTSFSLTGGFDVRHIIEEMGVVTLDKARSVQRKAGLQGRTTIIGARRTTNQFKRITKLATFGYVKYDGSKGFKKGKGIF